MAQNSDPYSLEGVKNRNEAPKKGFSAALLVVIGMMGLVILTPIPEKIRRKLGLVEPVKVVSPEPEIIVKEKVVEKVVEKEVRVSPPYYQVKKGTQISKTSKGFDFRNEVKESDGGLASRERKADGTYEVGFAVSVKRPRAAQTVKELAKVNAELPKILPGLAAMADSMEVSSFFPKLYENKRDRIQKNLKQFDRLLTKHNYYDCQTMVEMVHPDSGRKVFLAQSDMDVVTDGSDGDRLTTMPDEVVNSTYYQPFTSYGWPKTGDNPNPLIAGWQRRLATERAKASPSRARIKRLTDGIADMEKRSFLLAKHDPFIVIPVFVILDRKSPFGPNVGDYAAVIFKDKIYPAIVGDGGPSFKFGEASLRMARTINEKASSYYRPVSSVGVTYVVFPRTSIKKWAEPDYDLWYDEVQKFLGEIGGLGEGYELHRWESTLPVAVE